MMELVEGITTDIREGNTGGYTVADMRGDLAWVERRLAEMIADNWNPESIAKYRACAAELRTLIDADRAVRTADVQTS